MYGQGHERSTICSQTVRAFTIFYKLLLKIQIYGIVFESTKFYGPINFGESLQKRPLRL